MMISVEHLMQHHLPQLQQKPWLAKPVKGVLRTILHENELAQFAQKYPHLHGIEFVEQVLEYFSFRYAVRNNEIERIPNVGRVVIIANHPIGSLDGLALIKLLHDIRPDIKVVANELLMAIKPLQSLLLPVNNMQGGTDFSKLDRISTFLAEEGALIFFPAGEVSRLKANGIRDAKWHGGFLSFACRAKAPILPIYIEGRNSALFYGTSMLYKPLATILLVQEMFNQKHKSIAMRIGELIPNDSFAHLPLESQAKVKLFKKHLYRLSKDKKPLFVAQKAIAMPENRVVLRKAVEACLLLGETSDGKQVYLYQHQHQESSPILREIGRLREIAFRAVGEGTGQRRDIDRYDSFYEQLILWDKADLEIVGAYRFVNTEQVLAEKGLEGLYTASLFQYNQLMQPYLEQGLELGRSFVQPKYWSKRSLDYLWYGIGLYLKSYPEIRYLFGGVSLSNNYPKAARDLVVYFFTLYFGQHNGTAAPNRPYDLPVTILDQLKQHFNGESYSKDFIELKRLLANMGVSVPTLYKQYAELAEPGGVKFLAFGIDPDFTDCVDGLVLVDLTLLKANKRVRYLSYAEKPAKDAA